MGKCHQQNTNSHLFCVESLFENPRNKKILCTRYFCFKYLYYVNFYITFLYLQKCNFYPQNHFLIPAAVTNPPACSSQPPRRHLHDECPLVSDLGGSSWKVWNCWMIDRNCSLKGFKTWWPSIFREQSTSVSCLSPSQLTSQSFSRQSPNNCLKVL